MTDTFDIVVVGGGTAGLVIASRLSEDAAVSVLVLEAGPDLADLPEQLVQAVLTPAAYPQLQKTPIDWNLRTVPQAHLDGREICIPQGKILGGTSALNGLSFIGTSKAVIDGWAALGNSGWEWQSFALSFNEAFTLAKSHTSLLSKVRESEETEGPLKVAYSEDYTSGWPRIWADTIASLGFPGAQGGLNDNNERAGPGGLMSPDTIDPALGIRSYAANAYMAPKVRQRSNLTLLTGVEVKRVLLSKNGDEDAIATGVEYVQSANGVTRMATARQQVIVAAGTFGSPKILELSGIGDARRLGADKIIDVPGVGENLQNHPMLSMSFEVGEDAPPTMDAFLRGASRQDAEILGPAMRQYAEHRTGVFASSGVTSAAQLPLPGVNTPTGQKNLGELFSRYDESHDMADSDGFSESHKRFVRAMVLSPSEASGYYIFAPGYAGINPDGTGSYITVVLLLPHPLSRGSVHVVGTGSDRSLEIDPKYLSHPLDVEIMARHVQFIDQVLTSTAPLGQLLKPNGKRAVGYPDAGALKDTIEAAKEFVKSRAVGAHHYTGTCSMLPRNMGGVVDSQLKVYGTANLRVCDASIIPLTPRHNPQATVYSVAEHGAKIIKASLGRK